jgi:GT2 family glycosyltransferase
MGQVELTVACIGSLCRLSYGNTEVIVVDQASNDGSVERIRAQFPFVRVIASDTNLGFTGGNNLGMEYATGEYYLLLNNDTVVEPDFLEKLVAVAEQDKCIGALSPLIKYHQSPGMIQYAGGPKKLDLIRFRSTWRGTFEADTGQYHRAEETSIAHGAAFLVRRDVVDRVGKLDDRFFIYYEELDWSLRIRNAGYKIMVVPSSVILHKESMTVGKRSPFKSFYQTRNRILLNRIHAPAHLHLFFKAYQYCASLPVNIIRLLAERRWDLLKAHIKGFRQGWSLQLEG